ncbi:site-specific integrase [Aquimarina sp. AD10]|uniref:site-specific integrase n=1 Tax=Aquimarina sp. AD10 TaxID=1714849 RepID=UPI000E50CABC|nr:site-specific integrase [Aquimarina sp. AD10]AXT63092.1 site-specific integrase [Aquimarina sp. AD10]RKM98692.1 site-specific integrase [Aquimarina sp. AD10]
MELMNQNSVFVPQFDPQKMNGKLTYKVIIKSDYVRNDGTCALYLQVYLNSRKRIPLDISVKLDQFDKKKQRINKKCKNYKDYNLIIEKRLADINKIEVNYRLNNQALTLNRLMEELENPSLRIDYIAFAKRILEEQRGVLKHSTYRQQKGALSKIEQFKSPLYFYEINEQFLIDFRSWMKNSEKNKPATIEGTIKNFKKYLHAANKKGVNTELKFDDISVKKMVGDRTFLLPEELKILVKYRDSEFVTKSHKNILSRFLFSCFTGLRISDIESITEENFIGDHLAFTMQKTSKFIRIKLNQYANQMIAFPTLWEGKYTREHINRELKTIARQLGIKKNLHFHCSRHTFATNFLISGGRVENLQKLLGHSEIKETMIYVHIVEQIMDDQIDLINNLFK